MERSRAEAIVKSLQVVEEHLNYLHGFSEGIESEAEKKKFRRHLGTVMATLNADILLPIVREYPELDPDK
jgi:hypothetical protein